jgi:hypothetical protein
MFLRQNFPASFDAPFIPHHHSSMISPQLLVRMPSLSVLDRSVEVRAFALLSIVNINDDVRVHFHAIQLPGDRVETR